MYMCMSVCLYVLAYCMCLCVYVRMCVLCLSVYSEWAHYIHAYTHTCIHTYILHGYFSTALGKAEQLQHTLGSSRSIPSFLHRKTTPDMG